MSDTIETNEDKLAKLHELEKSVHAFEKTYPAAAKALAEIKANELWKALNVAKTFNAYFEKTFALSRYHGFRLVNYGIWLKNKKVENGKEPAETAVREILKKEYEPDRDEIYDKACEIAHQDGCDVPQKRHVDKAIQECRSDHEEENCVPEDADCDGENVTSDKILFPDIGEEIEKTDIFLEVLRKFIDNRKINDVSTLAKVITIMKDSKGPGAFSKEDENETFAIADKLYEKEKEHLHKLFDESRNTAIPEAVNE